MKDGPEFRRRLAAAKGASFAHALIRGGRLMNEAGVRRFRQKAGMAGLRSAQMALLPHLDLDGTRLGELAARLEVTKQAVTQLVDDLEALGVVERRPDPEDGRARRVHFTDRGRAIMLRGLEVLRELEEEILSGLSASRVAALRRDLGYALAALDGLKANDEA